METHILHSTPIADLKLIIGEVVREQLKKNESEKQQEPENIYMTRKEVCEKLRLTLKTVDKYTKLGHLKAYKIGGQIRYKSNEIDKSLEAVKSLKYRR